MKTFFARPGSLQTDSHAFVKELESIQKIPAKRSIVHGPKTQVYSRAHSNTSTNKIHFSSVGQSHDIQNLNSHKQTPKADAEAAYKTFDGAVIVEHKNPILSSNDQNNSSHQNQLELKQPSEQEFHIIKEYRQTKAFKTLLRR